MSRALQLARMAEGFTSPNPMVGAVIVADGRVIGEGFHRRCGGPHAEVWAVRSVAEADRSLLSRSTVYVTLEPCSHYGKTPPCAKMLVETGVRRVVVGCLDPNPKVSGRGIGMLREAGIEVAVDVMRDECYDLNRRFMVAQTLRRPYVMLKWASSADGYLDAKRGEDEGSVKFSTPVSFQAMHRLRALHDAVVVGSGTAIADNPSLSVRNVAALQPRPVVVDRRGRVPADLRLFRNPKAIYLSATHRNDLPPGVTQIQVGREATAAEIVDALASVGVSSVMVEGGAELLKAFVEAGFWDDARVETTGLVLGENGRARMSVPSGILTSTRIYGDNVIINVKNPHPSPR